MVFQTDLKELTNAYDSLLKIFEEDIINEPSIKQIKVKPKNITLVDSLRNGYSIYSKYDPFLSHSKDNLGNIECTCNTMTLKNIDKIETLASVLFKYSHDYLVKQAAKTIVLKVEVKESIFFNMDIPPLKERRKLQLQAKLDNS